MMRHHARDPSANEEDAASSSSMDEEDAFAAFSTKKRKKQKQTTKKGGGSTGSKMVKLEASNEKPTSINATAADADVFDKSKQAVLPISNTSSTKRHHGATSDTRQAKMDAILLELEAQKGRVNSSEASTARGGGSQNNARKKGSFVDDGDEHITTNIFVGNLAPSITEEQMTELFREFGENDTMISVMMTEHHSRKLCDD